jgi:subtilase family serine protease
MKIANPKFPPDIIQIIDSYQFDWNEDYGFYASKNKLGKNKMNARSQQLVDFFLGKVK